MTNYWKVKAAIEKRDRLRLAAHVAANQAEAELIAVMRAEGLDLETKQYEWNDQTETFTVKGDVAQAG